MNLIPHTQNWLYTIARALTDAFLDRFLPRWW